MKICMVLGAHFSFAKGGAEIQADILANDLIERGHDIHYICFGADNSVGDIEIKDNYNIYTVKRPYKNLNFLCYLNRKSIYQLLDKIDPDIIYQRGEFPFGDLISSYGNLRDIPIVSAISMDNMCMKRKVELNRKSIPCLIGNHMRVKYFDKSDLIISQTRTQKDLLKRTFGVDSIVIPNVHRVPKPPFKKDSPPLICWIANIKAWKKPEKFLQLAKKLENKEARFVMAGRPGTGSIQDKIDDTVRSLSNLDHLGEITFERANSLLKRASIFVNTSDPLSLSDGKTEGFPNTYIQSWMRETPVVALNFDPDGIIKKEKIGLHSNTFKQMVRDVEYLIEKENERKEMGRRARIYAERKFNVDTVIEKYEQIFSKLI